jgi:hypothetical protein
MLFLGTLAGGLLGLAFAFLQVKLVRLYAIGKEPHVQQRAYDTVDQLKLTSFLGLPLLFSVMGYMLSASYLN